MANAAKTPGKIESLTANDHPQQNAENTASLCSSLRLSIVSMI